MADASGVAPAPRTWCDLLSRAAERWPTSAVAFPTERLTFAALERQAQEYARGLLAIDTRPGDHVGVLMPPCVASVAMMHAVAKVGGVVVPISDRFKAAELRHLVHHADLAVVVTSDRTERYVDFAALLTQAFPSLAEQRGGQVAVPEAPRLRHLLLETDRTPPPGFTALSALHAAASDLAGDAVRRRQRAVRPADTGFLMYTSGTSAQPKGCVLTHAAITLQAQALVETRYLLTADDSFWCPLPIFHNGGISTLTACLTAGATFCHVGHFDPTTALEQLERERCTHWIPTFETIIMPILEHPAIDQVDLSRLRMGVTAGTPEFLRRFQRMLPTSTVVSNYGSTEAAGSAVMSTQTDPLTVRTETSGTPLPGMELRIVDPLSGHEQPAGVPGEIHFRGAMRFSSYYRDAAQTAAAIDADGWFRTGDIGALDADGRLSYRGRLKDMLKVGGENVAAAEIEAHLLTHPAVSVAAVVGARDARYTEVPAAFVMLKAGAQASETELIDFCVGQIATFKVPRYVRFVTEWPMSGTKIKKYLLREQLEQELDRAGVDEAPTIRSSTPTPGA